MRIIAKIGITALLTSEVASLRVEPKSLVELDNLMLSVETEKVGPGSMPQYEAFSRAEESVKHDPRILL